MWPLIKKKLNVLNAAGLDQDFSIDDVNITSQKESGQRDLSSYMNISPPEEDPEARSSEERKAPEDRAASSTSTSANELKKLLEVDEEYFDFCDWDDVI